MIRLEGISVRYGRDPPGAGALDGLDLVLPQGGIAFVTGPAGAGKTALLDLLHLAVPPSAGRAVVLDTDLALLDRVGRGALRRRTGRVFTPARLLEDSSVFDNVVLPLLLSADGAVRPDTRMRADVGELLGWLGLAAKSSVPARRLSLGERRLIQGQASIGTGWIAARARSFDSVKARCGRAGASPAGGQQHNRAAVTIEDGGVGVMMCRSSSRSSARSGDGAACDRPRTSR